MENWTVINRGAPFTDIASKFNISPVLARLIRNRGVTGDEAIEKYLNPDVKDLLPASLLPDMDKAARILTDKIKSKKKIRIIGDYDIDGVNASYILLRGIKGLGGRADVDIPDRASDGYGLNRRLLDAAYEDGADTILTCDNGIAAADEIRYAKSLHMTVVVTDHHEPPFIKETKSDEKPRYILPPADAVIDPKLPQSKYPFRELCGAGVAYKLTEELWRLSGRDFGEIGHLIENVAIATVGDVMSITGENRVFVKTGINSLKNTRNLGLSALMDITGIVRSRLSTYHLGFIIGPCINAAGRLDSAKLAFNLLCADTKEEAGRLAERLKELNDLRKGMTEKAATQAAGQIENSSLINDKVLVVYLPDCHESVAGIVAGRVRERYHRPAVIITDSGDEAKGSARSVDGYHMFNELTGCGDLFTKFGGHAQAAGFSLPRGSIDELRRRLNENAALSKADMREKVRIDMELDPAYLTLDLVDSLSLLEPYGKDNEEPLFAVRDVKTEKAYLIGKNRDTLKLTIRTPSGALMEALYFNDGEKLLNYIGEKYGSEAVKKLFGRYATDADVRLTLAYRPQINEYGGNKKVQLVIKHYR